ncbi:CRISPR-associated protein Cas4 [Puniceicoccaceae bacterium K14]|nr:CRISPR-associated protein Cas4 [Puniceicoccaceae bacterium K14]
MKFGISDLRSSSQSDDLLIAISALQHWLFCPRQCALIHVERAWSENRFTAEGNAMHERAHDGPNELRDGVRIARGQHVRSLRLGLVGQCDVVEFYPDGRVNPVEYKRGRPKAHRADEVQLCAQAICLEDMLGKEIRDGQLYYGKNRRRHDVVFDTELRKLVEGTARAIEKCLLSAETPKADYVSKKCDTCSLIDHCQPKIINQSVSHWFMANLKSQILNHNGNV